VFVTDTQERTKLQLRTPVVTATIAGALFVAAGALAFLAAPSSKNGIVVACSTETKLSAPVEEARAALPRASDQLRDRAVAYERARVKTRFHVSALEQAARERKAIVTALVKTDPAHVVASLSEDDRIKLGRLAPTCVEQPVDLQGRLEIFHSDTETEGDEGTFEFSLVTAARQKLALRLTNAEGNLKAGDQLRVKGLQLDDQVITDAETSANANGSLGTTLIASGTAMTSGDKGVLAIFYYYGPDGSSPPTDGTNPAALQDLLFNSSRPDSVKNFIEKDSYYDGTRGLTIHGDVFGWYNVNIPPTCDQDVLEAAVLNRLYQANPNINFHEYQQLILVGSWIGPDGQACSPGSAYVGAVPTPVPPNQEEIMMSHSWHKYNYGMDYSYGLSHEMGHGLGWMHANFINCTPVALAANTQTCQYSEYKDYHSAMGSSYSDSGILRYGYNNVALKQYIQWLETTGPHQIATVDQTTISANGEYTLVPVGSQTAGLKGLKIMRGPESYLYVEYRQPIGFDAGQHNHPPDNYYDGAIIHYNGPAQLLSVLVDATTSSGNPGSNHSPAMRVGYSNPDNGQSGFIEPLSGTRVEVVNNFRDTNNHNNSRLTVKVTLGQNYDKPVVSVIDPVGDTVLSGNNVRLAAQVASTWPVQSLQLQISCSQGRGFLRTLTTPASGTNLNGVYETFIDTRLIPNGDCTVLASNAVDDHGNVSQPAFEFTKVQNTDAIGPTIAFTSPPEGNNYPTTPAYILAQANVSDNFGIDRVEFYRDQETSPVSIQYGYVGGMNMNVTAFIQFNTNGAHEILARAYDTVGNMQEVVVHVTVGPVDQTRPTVSITKPANGSTVSGTVLVTAQAADNVGVSRVELYRDGSLLIANTASTLWNSNSVRNGEHSIYAKAYDAAGNVGTSDRVNIFVCNSGGGTCTPPPPLPEYVSS
jgi:hypothetical protein